MGGLKNAFIVTACIFGMTVCLTGTFLYAGALIELISSWISDIKSNLQRQKDYKMLEERTKRAYEASVKQLDKKEETCNGKE